MDFYERALYNDILASQDPDTGMFTYFMSLKPGISKPIPSRTFPSGAALAPAWKITRNTATAFIFTATIPCSSICSFRPNCRGRKKNLIVRQETKFPESDTTRLAFQTQRQRNSP